MKIGRDPPTKRQVFLPWKVVSNVPNIHLGIYKNYQNFHPLIFYGYTRLRGVGADLPPLDWIGLKELLWDTLYFPEILDIEHMHRLLALSYTFPC